MAKQENPIKQDPALVNAAALVAKHLRECNVKHGAGIKSGTPGTPEFKSAAEKFSGSGSDSVAMERISKRIAAGWYS